MGLMYDLNETIRKEIIACCKKYHVNKIILFGSRARGDNSPHSDIDNTFCLTFELSWKAMKYILESEGVDKGRTGSPKLILMAALERGLIEDEAAGISHSTAYFPIQSSQTLLQALPGSEGLHGCPSALWIY